MEKEIITISSVVLLKRKEKLHQTKYGKVWIISFEEVHLFCRVGQCTKALLTCLSGRIVTEQSHYAVVVAFLTAMACYLSGL